MKTKIKLARTVMDLVKDSMIALCAGTVTAAEKIGEKITDMMIKWWLTLEYRMALVDAHLAQLRGDTKAMNEWVMKSYDAQRKLQIIELNKRYGDMR